MPEEAIIWGSDGAHLFRVVDGTARRLPLTIVARREGLALVDAQLPRGATIIAKGAQKVRDGSKVEIVETQSAPTVRASKEGAAARSGRGRAAP